MRKRQKPSVCGLSWLALRLWQDITRLSEGNPTSLGFGYIFLERIMGLYRNASSEVQINGFWSTRFPIRSSISQGCTSTWLRYSDMVQSNPWHPDEHKATPNPHIWHWHMYRMWQQRYPSKPPNRMWRGDHNMEPDEEDNRKDPAYISMAQHKRVAGTSSAPLWPAQRSRAVLWIVAWYVSFRLNHPRTLSSQELMDFMRRSKWKMYLRPKRFKLVANFLTVLDTP